MIDNTKAKQKLGGLYLSTCILTQSNLLKIGVCGSTSWSDLVDSSSCNESSSLFFSLNHHFYDSSSLGSSSSLETVPTSLKITSRLKFVFLVTGFHNLYPFTPSLYLMKIHFSSSLSSLLLFFFGTCTKSSHPNTLRCEREGFLLVQTLCGVHSKENTFLQRFL